MGLGVFTTATAQCHELLSATRDWKSTFRTLKLWTTGEALWNITVDPYSVDLILAGCEAYSHFFLKIKTFVGQGEHHCYMNKKVWARVQATCVLCFSQKPGILCQTNQRNSSFRVKNLGKQALILLKMGAILQTFLTFSGEGGDSSLVVSLEINSVVYQGVLFAQPKSRSRSRERKENRISWMRPTTATTATAATTAATAATTHHIHREWRNFTQLGRVKINLFLSLFKLLNFNLKKKY